MIEINNRFYVYAYLDPRKPGGYRYDEYQFDHEPFYIGKGCGRRCENTDKRMYWLGNKIRKIERSGKRHFIIKLHDMLNEFEAYRLESEIIKKIGRSDISHGPLVNLTDGGDGLRNPSKKTRKLLSAIRKEIFLGSGNPFFGKKHTEQTRQKISQSLMGNIPYNKGIPMSNEQKRKLSKINTGKKLSKETKRKIKEIWRKNGHPWTGKKHSIETKRKISETKKRQARSSDMPYRWVVISPEGNVQDVRNLTDFCGNHSLRSYSMYRVARGVRSHHKGWKCFKK